MFSFCGFSESFLADLLLILLIEDVFCSEKSKKILNNRTTKIMILLYFALSICLVPVTIANEHIIKTNCPKYPT